MKAKKVVAKKATVKKVTASAKASAVKAKKEPVKKVEKATKPTKEVKTVAINVSDEAVEKQKIIEKFAQKNGDTGSPEVQIALLSYKIGRLSEHLNQNKKDNHSRRGLLKVVAKRRRILNYLQKLSEDRYKVLIGSLNLKK
ncbi:30S ribosomal protein S15 [Candidatus Woesebacteria bacterium]|jgi:small subunit ribosomal protein S15|nr:30S ribosomal protein S15 [Candidatus Woesebacteria bacterium]MBP6882921.1 30S ribosomal protein S15 [Candidatus Woesebacteria bacterium]QQR63458.1 MAG: 30S ribosomal protein S15 [Candidatus Roizmanbacteria bacterium]